MKNIVPINSKLNSDNTPRPAGGRTPRVIAITSGKGGVGKTNVTSNLAIALARQGSTVCVFDADTSLANINVVMGLSPRYTVEHLLNGEKSVDEILLEGPHGVSIVPAASGIAECANLDAEQRRRLVNALEALEDRFDYILIDTAAGIGESVLSFIQSAHYAIVVISTEPTSLTDAFALLRMLKRRGFDQPVYVLVNMVLNYANSMEVYKRFEAAVRKYLKFKVHYLGYITDDKAIRAAVGQQRPVILEHPEALASRCFTTLATVLGKQLASTGAAHGFSRYWKKAANAPTSHGAEGVAPSGSGREAQHPAPGVHEVGARALALIRDTGIPRDRLERLLGRLIEAYTDRFHRLPFYRLDSITRLLEQTDYSMTEFRSLLVAMEELFERRFQRPVHLSHGDRLHETHAEHDKVLEEYRLIASRIAAEEEELGQALAKLYRMVHEAEHEDGDNPGDVAGEP